MKSTVYTILLGLFCIAILSSCGRDDSINYREKIVGEWELKNVGDLQAFFRDRSFILKSAVMAFENNGNINTRMLSSRDEKTMIVHTGTWSMPTTGGSLTIKSDNGPFNDALMIEFTDERTFWITLNELEYQFVKIS